MEWPDNEKTPINRGIMRPDPEHRTLRALQTVHEEFLQNSL